MSLYSLTIKTLGICTHFGHGAVGGVPHRVVLPDATNIVTGLLTVKNSPVLRPSPVAYYLVPHFPRLETSEEVELTIPGLLTRGHIQSGIRIEVVNCVDRELVYQDDDTPKLTHYEPEYTFSSDVVLHGRAACYLDVYGGTVSWMPPPPKGGAGSVLINMKTDGPPELRVTTLAPWTGTASQSHCLPLAASGGKPREVLFLMENLELVMERPAEELHGEFDFLLHYLTARGGIPQSIKFATPGMAAIPRSVTPERLAQALRQLADLVALSTDPENRKLVDEVDLTASCAPSQYP